MKTNNLIIWDEDLNRFSRRVSVLTFENLKAAGGI
jgi:hypothetical protein